VKTHHYAFFYLVWRLYQYTIGNLFLATVNENNRKYTDEYIKDLISHLYVYTVDNFNMGSTTGATCGVQMTCSYEAHEFTPLRVLIGFVLRNLKLNLSIVIQYNKYKHRYLI
jgi:hypothetical protein